VLRSPKPELQAVEDEREAGAIEPVNAEAQAA
jgi:hypothetical protein